jgi:hypothetical protein
VLGGYLHPDVEFVETVAVPGGSGAEASMRFWNLITLDADRIARIEELAEETAALDAAGP